MTESFTYIKNVKIIDGSHEAAKHSDVLIKNDASGARIAQIGEVSLPQNAKISVFSANGAYACPGFIDMRAHLCAKGAKADAQSVSAAATLGGYSLAVICPDMPNDSKLALTPEKFKNLSFLAPLIEDHEAQKTTDLDARIQGGAIGFYDESTQDTFLLRKAMRECAQKGYTLFVKCAEKSLDGGVMNEGPRALQMKAAQIPALCEELALARYLMLARDTGCKLHVHAISTKGSVELIRSAKKNGVLVSADTCPQYFSLTDDQILFKGSVAKVDPPLRSIDDVCAVIDGIADGTIDAISTDHTPCDKLLKKISLQDSACGMIMLESAFLIGVTNLVEKGRISIYRLIDAMCYAPMRILDIKQENCRGLNLFSLSGETYASKSLFAGPYSNSAFESWHFSGKLIKYFPCEW